MIPATTATTEGRSNIWGGEGLALGGVEGVGTGGLDHLWTSTGGSLCPKSAFKVADWKEVRC